MSARVASDSFFRLKMIPRCFHWVWLGSEPLPQQHRDWMAGWERMHPDWDRRVWTDANRPPLHNEHSFLQAAVPAQRADILRYELVHRFGGVYLDTDMECLSPLDGLLEGLEAFAGEEEPGELGNSILGSAPGRPWLQDVIEQIPTSIRAHDTIPRATGPGLLTAVTRNHAEVAIFPPEIFYPYRAHEPSHAGRSFPSAHAVHRWHGSWVAPGDKFQEDFPREIERELRSLLPQRARILTLAEGIDLDLGERSVLPFVGREGRWANPEDSYAALVELEWLTDLGWDWLVVLEDAYWWFDYYAKFMATMEQRAQSTHRRRRFAAFQLAHR